jgi:SP family xylose:H+ symportor-like MFS transporter
MGICISIFGVFMYNDYSGIGALVILVGYIAFFSISQGPVVWVYLSELFPNKVRGSVMAIAVFAQWLANYLVSQTFPIMADEKGQLYQDYNGAFPFWLYGSFCVLAVIFIWKMMPETKGKTLEEIEEIWQE